MAAPRWLGSLGVQILWAGPLSPHGQIPPKKSSLGWFGIFLVSYHHQNFEIILLNGKPSIFCTLVFLSCNQWLVVWSGQPRRRNEPRRVNPQLVLIHNDAQLCGAVCQCWSLCCCSSSIPCVCQEEHPHSSVVITTRQDMKCDSLCSLVMSS